MNKIIYHKSTYSNLLLTFNSFTSRFYKISLIKWLIDRAYKINNTWTSFHIDATKIKYILKRNSSRLFLINKITKSCFDEVHSSSDQASPECDETLFTNFDTLENIQRKFRKSCH